ncbi:MAG TPA: hypothetical protein VFO89_17720 [Thermoanaerobaculia bacterium]|nr:hypothetical protein [Thermoanaerobaculia bacterium]
MEWILVAGGLLSAALLLLGASRRGEGASVRLSPPMLLFLRILLGILFAILGVVGSLLPIMQGWIFFLLAALVLFPQSRFAVKAVSKIEPKMPRTVAWLRRMGIGTPAAPRDTMPAE